jgi:predicted aminopeptidase
MRLKVTAFKDAVAVSNLLPGSHCQRRISDIKNAHDPWMSISSWTLRHCRRVVSILLLLSVVAVLSGCHTISFYSQAAKGQFQLIATRESVKKLLAASGTQPRLRERLELVQELRRFAEDELKLPVDGHYQDYADLHRSFVVWNVEAAPEFSMKPKTWWYPIVGRLDYRGYFSEKGAHKYGEWLRRQGYEVYYGGASAYSTLGWFRDPVLNTFLFDSKTDVAETIFHELGHQVAFASGDTDFNEAFATTVGQEGARRWARSLNDSKVLEAYQVELQRDLEFVGIVMKARLRLELLYGDTRTDEGKIKASRDPFVSDPERMREEKRSIIENLRREYGKLKESWGGDGDYDGWFDEPINNAKLNSVAAYYDLVPGFKRLLETNCGDLKKFYGDVQRLADAPREQRRQRLRMLAEAH